MKKREEIVLKHPMPWYLDGCGYGVFFHDKNGQFIPQPLVLEYIKEVNAEVTNREPATT